MNLKKNPDQNLEQRRFSFFQIGLILSLSLSLVAFEWGAPVDRIVIPEGNEIEPPMEVFIPTLVKKKQQTQKRTIRVKLKAPKPGANVVEGEEIKEKLDLTELEKDLDKLADFSDAPVDEPTDEENLPLINGPVSSLAVQEMPHFYECHELKYGEEVKLCFEQQMKTRIEREITKKNLQNCMDRGETGVVYVSFVINSKGELEKLKFENTLGPCVEKNLREIFETIPKMHPGKHHGIPVPVKFVKPFDFRYK